MIWENWGICPIAHFSGYRVTWYHIQNNRIQQLLPSKCLQVTDIMCWKQLRFAYSFVTNIFRWRRCMILSSRCDHVWRSHPEALIVDFYVVTEVFQKASGATLRTLYGTFLGIICKYNYWYFDSLILVIVGKIPVFYLNFFQYWQEKSIFSGLSPHFLPLGDIHCTVIH